MKAQFNQKGFATWELALGVLVLASIAFAGYHVYTSGSNAPTSANQTTASSALSGSAPVAVPAAPTISSTADLDKATAILNQTDPSTSYASDNNQLDSQTSF